MRTKLWFLILTSVRLVAPRDVSNVALRATGAQAATSVGQTTLSPASVITPASVVREDIFKRAIATCGFVRGNSASAVTCPQDYNCITTARAVPLFACCNNIECKDNWGVCRPYGQTDCMGFNLPDGSCSSVYGSILQCSSDAPQCLRYARSAALGDTDTYYSYACGTATDDILMLAKATNGGAAPTQNPDPNGGDSGSSVIIPGVNLPAATNTSPGGTTGGSGSGSSSGSGGGSSLSITAIALISVAGAGVIFFALLIGYCCWWRESQKKKRDILNPPQPPQLKHEGTVTTGPGPGSIASWNLLTPTGANPHVPPSYASVSEYGDYGPSVHQPLRPMDTLHEQHSQRSFGYGSR